ncbi:unnamed protein product [Rotaria magnacalcarata]|uniref:Uncharacterized protein n=1 Tax=Rotaria magnacalcarata TaxID=392030 RepID=A0A816PF15_9BILA|nr:unnamed protein product [Rotaria magnacalcarata]
MDGQLCHRNGRLRHENGHLCYTNGCCSHGNGHLYQSNPQLCHRSGRLCHKKVNCAIKMVNCAMEMKAKIDCIFCTLAKLFKQFRRKTNDNEYQKLDEDSNLANKQQNISFFQLFRFADRFDFILLSIGLIGVVLVSLCFSANLIIFGKLTAVFAEVSSSGKCQNQQHNVSFLTTSTNGCPFSINPNAKNYSHLYRFCNGHEFTNVALSASSVRSSHSQMMEYIYLLLSNYNRLHILG